jgi:hypothetical protein
MGMFVFTFSSFSMEKRENCTKRFAFFSSFFWAPLRSSATF